MRYGDLTERLQALRLACATGARKLTEGELDPIFREFGDFNYFFCPNTGRIITGMEHDDKVLCGCGRTNPAVAARSKHDETQGGNGAAHHLKRFLAIATMQDWAIQRMQEDDAAREGVGL